MKELTFDAIVIGGGAAGMAAALEIKKGGYLPAIIDREETLGGILLQCIHNGFGLHEFKEELTGPEYAELFSEDVKNNNISIFNETTVIEIIDKGINKEIIALSSKYSIVKFIAKVVVLAMGCRERNRGNINIAGSRPAGIMTAGLAQRLINIEGLIPGKEFIILGSGDIGLIMARRLTWSGCKVHAVIEIQSHPSGLNRNIVQCLNDFNIPLYLSHTVTKIYGKDRVNKAQITPIIDGVLDYSKSFEINCDTILLSVGLIPENELSKKAGIIINQQTGGPLVDATMMTSIDGIFACGNVLHVHDLVDFVTEESKRTGKFAVDYLNNIRYKKQISIKTGKNIRYINPTKINLEGENKFYLRPLITKNNTELIIKLNDKEIKRKKFLHIQPSEMITFSLDLREFNLSDIDLNSFLEVSIS